ncbi:hypothetical protein [Xanthomonas theicola]|uniref:hypothetical protein n=1 Tax=Xanthomonas theicola TaxID=56464 RepID=UPI00130489AB|nr:hypothetical protein [Xanthomonas theicola]QNH23967.1 hypothetical protein G4Q83_03230 [Xanthomonas theicola]
MKEMNNLDVDAVFGGVGTAGAPPISGNELIGGSREAASFLKGFLQGFYDTF